MTQKYRKGDLVSIQAVVENHYADTDAMTSIRNMVSIRVEGQSTMLVKPEELTMIQPYFAPGERVQKKLEKPELPINRRIVHHPVRGTVVAMSEGNVWVKFDHGKHGTVPAVELEPSTEKGGLHVVAA